jgi:transcription initiation factor TFIIIB Brf1 subunit/transcription initiation factor TFIIB
MPDDNDDNELINCDECSNEMSRDDSFTANNGEIVCSDCSRVCEYCERLYTSSDEWYNVDDQSWCEGCWSNNSFTCSRCDYITDSNRDGGTCIGDGSEYWCEDCVSNNATYCDECDEYYRDSGGECSCSESANGKIHQYSYKPNPVFHGGNDKNLYMGFELEMSFGDDPDRGDFNTAVSDVLELEQADVCYLKQDGSISGWGYELVTHPHTLTAYEQATDLWNYIEACRKRGARSWDTDSCGLHVHVSRSAFKSGAHTHRFLSLIYRNPREMMKLAGRKNSRFARFDDVYKPDEWGIPQFNLRDKVHGGGFSERYSAVNTNNDYTLELRFFRGNMKREGIMSALELSHASVEYTRNMSVPDVKLGMLKWEWFADWVATNNGLYPNLYQRMSKVPSISLSTPTLINA